MQRRNWKVDRRRELTVSWKVELEERLKAQAGDGSEGLPKDLTADESRKLSWKAAQEDGSPMKVGGRLESEAGRLIASENWRLAGK